MTHPFDPIDLQEDEAELQGSAKQATVLFTVLAFVVGGAVLGAEFFLQGDLPILTIIEWVAAPLLLSVAFAFIIKRIPQKGLELLLLHTEDHALLEGAIEGTNTGLWAWDISSGDLRWSPICGQLFGYDSSLKKPNLKSWTNRVFPADRPHVEAQIKLASEGQREVSFEYRRLLPDGSSRWTQSSARSIRDDNGKAVALSGISRDISSLHKKGDERIEQERMQQRNLTLALFAIAHEVEQREPYRAVHLQRLALLAAALGRKLGLSAESQEGLRVGAYLHDIGKIKIPSSILNRKGPLNIEEQSLLQTHPQRGAEIFKGIKFPWPLQQMIAQHQERLDGSGYPHHYKGDQICMEARILAVADTVVSMAAPRPHRPALGLKAALQEVLQRRGIMYDEKVVMACVELFTKDGFTLPPATTPHETPPT